MKTIHNFNQWSFIITLLCYLTILGGLLAQIVLGGIQIILAITVSFYWKKISDKIKHHLTAYWSIVAVYGMLWFLYPFQTNNDFIMASFYCVLPMSIAGYFVYITYETKKSNNELKLSHL